MDIYFRCDQARALGAGIDAPDRVRLTVDPSALDEGDRVYLAERVTARGTPPVLESSIVIVVPTLDGVREAIRTARAVEAANLADKQERQSRATIVLDEEVRRGIAVPETRRSRIFVTGTGNELVIDPTFEPSEWLARRTVEYPHPARYPEGRHVHAGGAGGAYAHPSDEVRAEYHEAARVALAERDRRIAEIEPELRAEAARTLAERAATTARIAQERAELYARLDPLFRARADANRATSDEVNAAIGRLLRADAYEAGFPEQLPHRRTDPDRLHSWRGWQALGELGESDPLTDAQFARLREIERGALPTGAEIEIARVWDWVTYPCDDHDTYDRECEDCSRERTNERVIARVVWSRGGVETYAALDLD